MSPPRKVKDLSPPEERLLDEENERFRVKMIDPASLASSVTNSREGRLNSPKSGESSPVAATKNLNNS